MKKYLLCFFCIGVFCICCKKEGHSSNDLLIGKWQFYLSAITYQGVDACQYNSKPADLYVQSSNSSCEKDNVWEFSSNRLTIHYGALKCRPDEPAQLVQAYQKNDSSLTIDGRVYKIVMLSSDTLIVDYCQQINNNVPGSPPVGANFVRVAGKYIRLK